MVLETGATTERLGTTMKSASYHRRNTNQQKAQMENSADCSLCKMGRVGPERQLRCSRANQHESVLQIKDFFILVVFSCAIIGCTQLAKRVMRKEIPSVALRDGINDEHGVALTNELKAKELVDEERKLIDHAPSPPLSHCSTHSIRVRSIWGIQEV